MPTRKLDPYRDLFNADYSPDRLEHDLNAFAAVLREIEKLRRLELTDIHPAVVFDPSLPYSKERDA